MSRIRITGLAIALASLGSTSELRAQRQSFELAQLERTSIVIAVTEPGTIYVIARWTGVAERVGIGRTAMVAATLPLSISLSGPAAADAAGSGTPTGTANQSLGAGMSNAISSAVRGAGGGTASTYRTRNASTSQQGEMLRENVTSADIATGSRWMLRVTNPTSTTSLLTGRVCVTFVRPGGPPPPICD